MPQLPEVALANDDGTVVCERCLLAETPLARLRGLLGRSGLSSGEGLLLRPAGSIHTAFMRFTIDAVFLDLAYLGRLLRPGAIVFLDDYHLPAIARAASFFLTNRGWALEEISTAEDRHHWAVLRTSTTPDTRPFDYFVDF